MIGFYRRGTRSAFRPARGVAPSGLLPRREAAQGDEQPVHVVLGRQVVHDPGAQVRPTAQLRGRDPALARDLEGALQAVLVAVEGLGVEARGRGASAGQVAEADDRQLGLRGQRSRSRRSPRSARARWAARSQFISTRRPRPSRPQVLPGEPELEAAEAARALERVLVPVERLLLGTARAVVLGLAVEGGGQVVAALHQQAADVVGLEQPLVRVDGDGVGAVQGGHAGGQSRAESGAAPP